MRALNVLAGIALAASLVGCRGGDAEPAADPTTSDSAPETPAPESTETEEAAPSETPEQALEAAYREYIAAFLSGDGATAYGLLSQRCQDLHPLSEFAEGSEQAADLYGEVDYEIKSVEVNGDKGKLDAEYAVEALNQGGGSEWVLEGGEWRSDKCD